MGWALIQGDLAPLKKSWTRNNLMLFINLINIQTCNITMEIIRRIIASRIQIHTELLALLFILKVSEGKSPQRDGYFFPKTPKKVDLISW